MVSIEKPNRYLCQVAYKAGEADIFFFANISLSDHISSTLKFAVPKDRYPWIWDSESGEKYRYPTAKGKKEVQIELAPSSSMLIVFDTAENGDLYQLLRPGREGILINGPWKLKLNHVNGRRRQTTMRRLADFQRYNRLKTFAGVAVYENEFRVEEPEGLTTINLGDVQGVSELAVNGQNMGVRWYGRHIYNISGSLVKGKNSISIKITTVAGNYLKSLKDNPTAQRWTSGQPFYPAGMMGPVELF